MGTVSCLHVKDNAISRLKCTGKPLAIELASGVRHVPLFQNNNGTASSVGQKMQLTGQNLHNVTCARLKKMQWF